MIYFTANKINSVCHSIRTIFRVLGIYNFVLDLIERKSFLSGRYLSFLCICGSFIFLLFLHISQSQYFFIIWILFFLIHEIWKTSRNKFRKHSVFKSCSELSLFEQIVPVISKCLQILSLHLWISKVFLDQ